MYCKCGLDGFVDKRSRGGELPKYISDSEVTSSIAYLNLQECITECYD